MHDWLIPIFFWFSAQQMTDYSPQDRRDYSMQVHINGSFEANSNSLNTEMIRFFLAGRYIDENMKDRSLKRMKNQNRLGMEMGTEIGFLHKPDSGFGKNWSYSVNVGYRFLFGGTFSRDAYRLGLYGNAPFVDERLDLSGLNARFLGYQYLQMGFVKEFSGKTWHKGLGFGLGVANANQFFSLSLPRGSIFTREDGQYLDVDADFSFAQNDASKNRFFYPNGFGLFGNLNFVMTDRKRHLIYVKADQFGMMRFNRFSSTRSLDTAFTFSGVNVDNLLNVNGNLINETVDSLTEGLSGRTAGGAVWLPMPGRVEIGYSYTVLPRRLFMNVSGDFLLFPGYLPRGTLRITGIPDPFVSVSGTLAYGGWGGFNVGLDLGFHFGQGWHFTLGTQTLQSIAAERISSGLSLRAGLVKRFGKNMLKTETK
jgi:hypothetical protein